MSEDKKQTPEGQPVNPNVELVNIDEELKTSYLAYSMSVIVGRALPDVRDGLKPVHRRILYAMDKIGCDRTTRKSARIVGDVIGKYHPHGDTAAYDALVRLAQPFNMRYTLVEGQGNFGSIDGDGAAAQRYTEAKLDRISEYVLCDLDKDTVDFVPNFDGAEVEPVVLATKIPLLLVNGSNGIAVGMATNIPPHNLNEICDGLVHLMKNPDCTTRDLMQHVKGPDFPTFGTIYGRKGIYDAYNTGQGKIQMRARVEEEVVHGHNALVIKEIPYQVNRSRLIKSIQELVKEKRIEGIHDIRNESGRSGKRKGTSSGNQGNSLATRIVIELKKDAIPQLVLNQLYKMTQLQTTFGVIMLAVVNNRPMVLSLKEVLSYFIEFRRDVVVRRHIYLLRKAREREHILRGFEIALDHIDEVIAIIRGSDDANQARERLTERFGLSEIQTKAILEMRLQRLTGMERSKVLEELANIIAAIKEYEIILKSKERLDEIIIGEFNEVKTLFGDERRTQIVDSEVEIEDEDLIAEEFCMVMRTQQNYIKRQALSEYRAQKRGGRGKVGMGTKEDDYVRDLFVASSHQIIQVYTTLGRVFSLKVYELPQGSRSTKGKPIVNMLPKLEANEDVAAILPLPMGEKTGYILMATEQGIMKKTPIEAFKNCRKNGLKAITFREGDKLMGVRIVQEEDNVLFVTADGMSLHYETKNMRPSGRTSMGVKAMKLKEGDRLIGMDVISDADCMILTVTERGYGKRTSISEHRTQNRGGMGIRGIKTHERNGKVVSALVVQDDDHLILATDGGTIIRTRVSEIRITGRTAAGVKLMNIGPDEHVVAVAAVSEENDDDIELTSVPVDDSVDEDDGMDEEEEILEDEMPEDDIIEEEEEPENEE